MTIKFTLEIYDILEGGTIFFNIRYVQMCTIRPPPAYIGSRYATGFTVNLYDHFLLLFFGIRETNILTS